MHVEICVCFLIVLNIYIDLFFFFFFFFFFLLLQKLYEIRCFFFFFFFFFFFSLSLTHVFLCSPVYMYIMRASWEISYIYVLMYLYVLNVVTLVK